MFFVQGLIYCEVPKIKEEVTHACILPIKNADRVIVIDEIAGEQVIVARSDVCCASGGKCLLHLIHQGKNLRERFREGNIMFDCQCMIASHCFKWRKGAWESWPGMIAFH